MVKLAMLILLGAPGQDEALLKSSWPRILEAWTSIEKYRPQVGRAGLDDNILRITAELHGALKAADLMAEAGEYPSQALKCFITLCWGRVLRFPDGLDPADELDPVDPDTEVDVNLYPLRALIRAVHRSRNLRPTDAQEKPAYDELMATASQAMRALRISSGDTFPGLEARALALIRAAVLGTPYPEHRKAVDDQLLRLKGLIVDLGHEEIAARETAMKALAESGDVALPLIREALKSQGDETRSRARKLLGFNHEPWKGGGRQERGWVQLRVGDEVELPLDK